MARLGLERSVVDAEVLKRTAWRFRQAGVVLPTIAQLTDPSTIPTAVWEKLRAVEPDAPHPLNLFRVHWFNDASRKGLADVPALCRTAGATDRREGAYRAAARQPFSDDPRPQGARRLWLPRSALVTGAIRSDPPPRGVAFDRELLPRRRRHFAHSRLPRRRGAAGKHEQ